MKVGPSKKDGQMFRGFERRLLGMIYDPIDGNGTWRTGHSSELYRLCDEPDIDKVVK
jgi:hypothetical protein